MGWGGREGQTRTKDIQARLKINPHHNLIFFYDLDFLFPAVEGWGDMVSRGRRGGVNTYAAPFDLATGSRFITFPSSSSHLHEFTFLQVLAGNTPPRWNNTRIITVDFIALHVPVRHPFRFNCHCSTVIYMVGICINNVYLKGKQWSAVIQGSHWSSKRYRLDKNFISTVFVFW